MCTPKSLVAEVATKCMGKVRTPDTFAKMIAFVSHEMRKINVPPSLISRSAFATVCLGFVRDVDSEISLMHGIVKPCLNSMNVHNDALTKFDFKFVWNFKKVATVAATVGAAVIGAAAAHVLPVTAGVVAAGTLVGNAAIAHLAKKVADHKDPFHSYYIDRSSVVESKGVIPLSHPVVLPSTDPAKTLGELAELEIDSTASISVPDETLRTESACVVAAGIVSTHNIPVVPSRSAHSSISCLKERALKKQPYHDKTKFNLAYWNRFESFVKAKLRTVLPGMVTDKVIPTSDAIWDERFPVSQQVAHRKARVEWDNGDYRQWVIHARKAFVKGELLLKSTSDGVPKLAPRCIQGASDIHSVVTGPFFHSFSKRLKEEWSVLKGLGPMYASGHSAEILGKMFEDSIGNIPNPGFLEGDFSRLDTTIHEKFLNLEMWIYKECGASDEVLYMLNKCIRTKGYMSYGISYAVDGTRHSGDQQTSCGNTLLVALSLLFVYMDHHKLTLEQVLAEVALPALGDDSVLIAPESRLKDLEKHSITGMLLKLGLDYEPVFHFGPTARFHVTFCSARFYPCANSQGEDVCVLAPKIGRVYGKMGYYCSPQNVTSGYMTRMF